MIGTIQTLLFLGLALVGIVIEAWALLDALRRPPQAFSYAGKRTRTFWLLLLGGAAVLGFLSIPPPLGVGYMPVFIMLGAIVPAAVYLSDVRPAVRGFGRRRPPRGGGW